MRELALRVCSLAQGMHFDSKSSTLLNLVRDWYSLHERHRVENLRQYRITIQVRLEELLRTTISLTTLPELQPPQCTSSHRLPPLREQSLLRQQGRLRMRFTKRLQGRMRYYCSYNSRQVTFKISIPYAEERVCCP